jgi:energy-coupling factor transport system ATP-binding protein
MAYMALVAIDNLNYQYPQTDAYALQNLSLTISAGSLTVIIGANDAGKSTLCHALTGFIPHFFHGRLSGSIRFAGQECAQWSLTDWVQISGLVFQNPVTQLSGVRETVADEIAFGLENLGVPREEMEIRITEVLAITGLTRLAGRHPLRLSGGQQQRVAIAAMLAMQPQLLVLDEPAAQLDPVGGRALFTTLHNLSRRGMTLVVATHKLAWAALADQVLLLDHGRLRRHGSPREILTDPNLAEFGLMVPPFISAARQAREIGLWPETRPLPLTLAEAAAGFQAGLV